MENFKLAKFIHSESAFYALCREKLPIEYAKQLNDFLAGIFPQINEFKEINNKLVMEKYGVLENNRWNIPPENVEAFEQEINPYLEKELIMQPPQLLMPKLSDMGFNISADNFAKLENFLIFS